MIKVHRMRYAIKNKKLVVTAYQLGEGSVAEKQLIDEGAICRMPDGSYELFSQESRNQRGEIAQHGDYFKVDCVAGKHFPYPNKKEWFEANHVHIAGNEYMQRVKPLRIWEYGNPSTEEIEFLLGEKKLEIKGDGEKGVDSDIDSGCKKDFFRAFISGTHLSAPEDAVVVLYEVTRDCKGKIIDIDFNFVARHEFKKNYTCFR